MKCPATQSASFWIGALLAYVRQFMLYQVFGKHKAAWVVYGVTIGVDHPFVRMHAVCDDRVVYRWFFFKHFHFFCL